MNNSCKPLSLPLHGQLLYASGSAAFTILERMILLYMPFYYMPPAEFSLPDLISGQVYLGFITVMGAALMAGRILDGLSDPLIASLSDNNRSRFGRRKIFLLVSGLPLALFAALVFYPPFSEGESLLNGIWLGSMMIFFYVAFTAYVNPYLALLPELGHNNSLRINLSTMIAFFGLLGMVLITVIFPVAVGSLQDSGADLRSSYRGAVLLFVLLAVVLLYLAAAGFNEKIHGVPSCIERIGAWQSLKSTYSIRAFRIFLAGELFLQFAMNIVTLGLIYYAVVLFQKEQRFIIILAGLTLGGALLCFPAVNIAAKKYGKKRIITLGVLCLAVCGALLFILSFNLTGLSYVLGLTVFVLAGFPLAVLTILINPTIADMARADYFRTGRRREAMFFGARAVPLKLAVALAGVCFAFLLSAFGKDIGEPLGVRLSALVIALSGICSYILFRIYPEKEVLAELDEEN
ncbi:MAG: MFS transporter [Bacillota bacterium]